MRLNLYSMDIYLFIFTVVNFKLVVSFNLTILHTNDVHSHYDEINQFGGQCSSGGTCYGGMARLKSKVEEIRSMNPNTLFLDAGDQYQGTLWFSQHGGGIVRTYMNLLGYNAMALGNHEFDRGIEGLSPLLNEPNNFTVLSCNIDARNEPSVLNKVQKHVKIRVDGEDIGVIGYTTKSTPMISSPGNLIFADEVNSIRTEVGILQSQGINKIIAVGHAGYTVDKKIAGEIEGIDIVIGGHTNTFLYTGTAPSNEQPVNVYPTIVEQNNGDEVLVVQDYAFAKYLGFLQVQFDNNGKITSYSGNPILLDNTIRKDAAVQNVTEEFGVEVKKMMNDVIGRTLVFLDGDRMSCRKFECNMGNLVADALVHQNLLHADSVDGTKVFISLLNAGSIRSSIEVGNITVGHAFNTQPYRNTVETIRLKGDYLLQALERSVEKYNEVDPGGEFLQYSGIKVVYDLSKPPGKRVVEAYAICQNCTIPSYEPIDKNIKYWIILSNYILSGGDGYTMIKDNAELLHTVGDLDSTIFIEYIRNVSPVYHGKEGRIQFVNSSNTQDCGDVTNGSKSTTISVLVFVLICAFSVFQ